MFNSAIFSIHWVDGYTRVHLAGSSREKVQNHKELMGQVGESPGNTADCVFNCFDCGVHVGFNGNAEHGRRYQTGRSVGVLQRSRTNWQISKWNFQALGATRTHVHSPLPALTPPNTPAHLQTDWCDKPIQLISRSRQTQRLQDGDTVVSMKLLTKEVFWSSALVGPKCHFPACICNPRDLFQPIKTHSGEHQNVV